MVLIGGAVVVIAAASSHADRRSTPRTAWILLAVVLAIAGALGIVLSMRHGV